MREIFQADTIVTNVCATRPKCPPIKIAAVPSVRDTAALPTVLRAFWAGVVVCCLGTPVFCFATRSLGYCLGGGVLILLFFATTLLVVYLSFYAVPPPKLETMGNSGLLK